MSLLKLKPIIEMDDEELYVMMGWIFGDCANPKQACRELVDEIMRETKESCGYKFEGDKCVHSPLTLSLNGYAGK